MQLHSMAHMAGAHTLHIFAMLCRYQTRHAATMTSGLLCKPFITHCPSAAQLSPGIDLRVSVRPCIGPQYHHMHQPCLRLTVPQTVSTRSCAGTLQRLRDSWQPRSGSLRMPAVQIQ